MECNKDEALRAKEIAEKKLAALDYASAKKFAHKAQQLYPTLENLPQTLAAIDVQVAAQVKLNGTERDWYGILQVDPTADDLVIKKQYRRLALLLHPDKNKSAGAEAAFKLIGEASQALSDKTKRLLYDMRAGVTFRTTQSGNASQHTQNVQQTGPSNGQHSAMRSQSMSNGNGHFPRMPSQAPTFWTACPSCQMRYQYLIIYENQNLLCPHCRLPFVANDINCTQGNRASAAYCWSAHVGSHGPQDFYHRSSRPFGTGFTTHNGFMSGFGGIHTDPVFSGVFSASMPATATKPTADYVQHMYDKVNRGKAEAEKEQKRKKREEERKEKEVERKLRRREKEQQRSAKAEERSWETIDRLMMRKKEQVEKEVLKEKKRRFKKNRSDSSSEDEEEQDDGLEDMLSYYQRLDGMQGHPRRSSRSRRNVTYKVDESDDDDLQDFLAFKKARVTTEEKDGCGRDSCNLGSGGAPVTGMKGSETGPESKEKRIQGSHNIEMAKKLADLAKNAIREKLKLHGLKSGHAAFDSKIESVDTSKGEITCKNNKCDRVERREGKRGEYVKQTTGIAHPDNSLERPSPENLEPESYSVPDADFHNFDIGREEGDIATGQIWALYDDRDGMPRYYIRVREVCSYTPFKVDITWLEPRNPSPDQREVLDSGFGFTCGEFRNTQSGTLDTVNMFSHIVRWEKGLKGVYRVYPRKGDIWGLFRNWEPGQKVIKVSESILKYDMVEILTEHTEQTGVVVQPLVKVKGFKTLFQQSKETTLFIPSEELLRFSHQVPAYKLKGDEAPNVPPGCWELDPASVHTEIIFPGCNADTASN